jgi:hypothetical protein
MRRAGKDIRAKVSAWVDKASGGEGGPLPGARKIAPAAARTGMLWAYQALRFFNRGLRVRRGFAGGLRDEGI